MKYKNKRVLVFKKGQKVHLDEIEYPQSRLMCSFNHEPFIDDDLSDDFICIANCRMVLEWDDVKEE